MTRDKYKFISFIANKGGYVTYGDNNKGKFFGIGNIANSLTTLIENVLFVAGLQHNLLSISHFCDKGYKIA